MCIRLNSPNPNNPKKTPGIAMPQCLSEEVLSCIWLGEGIVYHIRHGHLWKSPLRGAVPAAGVFDFL